jgi:8-amino-7-oxononanoate synthase
VDNLAQGRVDLAFADDDPAGVDQARRLWRGTPWILCQGDTGRFAAAGAAGANVLTALLLSDVEKLRARIDAYRAAHAGRGHVTLLVRASANRLRAAEQIERLAAAGADEIACLVDLGRPREEILPELRGLAKLVRPADDLEAGVRSRLTRRAGGGVLDRARDFDLADRLTDAGLMPFYPDFTDSDGPTVAHAGRRLIMLGANNYLGLTADKRVREATAAAALAEGPSVSGSRLLNGSTPAQRRLERALARFVGRQDALVFTTGYQANLGLLSAFMGEGTVLVADEECHASAHDGVAVGGGRLVPFRHNDVADLDRRLTDRAGATMVMVDGVYSMSGDLAPLAEIRAVCDSHGVPLAVDDAHGLGMAGEHGRGVEEELGVPGCADVLTGTFSKSLASVGGWLAGSAEVVNWVRYNARPMVFSAAISPPAVAAAASALEILAAEPERVTRVRELADHWRSGLTALGFDTGTSRTAIVPVHVGDELTCLRFARALLDAGVYANCVLAPAVPANRAMVRTTVSAAHETHHLDTALAAFASAGRELGLI